MANQAARRFMSRKSLYATRITAYRQGANQASGRAQRGVAKSARFIVAFNKRIFPGKCNVGTKAIVWVEKRA